MATAPKPGAVATAAIVSTTGSDRALEGGSVPAPESGAAGGPKACSVTAGSELEWPLFPELLALLGDEVLLG